MNREEINRLKEEETERRDTQYDTYKKKAMELDDLLPGFLEHAAEEYNKYIANELSIEGQDTKDIEYDTIDYYLKENWLEILKNHYEDIINAMPLESMYWLDEIAGFFFVARLFQSRTPFGSTLSDTFDCFSDSFDYYIWYDEDRDFELEEEIKWSYKEENDEDYLYELTKDNSIRTFYCKDETINLDDVVTDYDLKKRSLFTTILPLNAPLYRMRKWVEDFVIISELLLQGKYLWNDRIVLLDDLNCENDEIIDWKEHLLSEVLSFRTCYMYFVNYNEKRTDESFLELIRLAYLTCMSIYDRQMVQNDVFEMNGFDLLNKLYNYVNHIYEECVHENRVGIRLNCLPKSINMSYRHHFAKHADLFTPYHDAISPYAEVLTWKDRRCLEIAAHVIVAGYDRADLKEYIEEYIRKNKNQNKYLEIYNRVYELALVHQVLFLVSNAVAINNHLPEEKPNLIRLCSRIQDYVYEDYGYARIEKELETIDSRSIYTASLENENQLYHQFMYVLDSELDTSRSFEEIFEIHKSFASQLYNYGIKQESISIITEINQKVLSLLEEKAARESLYKEVAESVKATIGPYISSIANKINSFVHGDSSDVYGEFERLIRKVTTAELLYKEYVQPYMALRIDELPEEIREMDFGFIALEYYSALELLSNLLLYIPYRDKVLQPQYEIQRENLDKESGYFGNADIKRLVDKRERAIKPWLEMGPLSYLYMDSIKNGKVKKEFVHISEYLNSMNLSMSDANRFAKKLIDISRLRNEAAHGGNNLDINRARKAQDVSYVHLPRKDQFCQINIADRCHEEIIEQMRWFSK